MADHLLNEFLTEKYFDRRRNYSIREDYKRQITYKMLRRLIQHQVPGEEKGDFYLNERINLPPQAPADYSDQNWDNFCNSISQGLSNRDKEALKWGKSLLGIVGYNKLKGMIDQYVWDRNEDEGKILFSDQEGETLNFQNKEIHYYKKSETVPLTALKRILRGIQ